MPIELIVVVAVLVVGVVGFVALRRGAPALPERKPSSLPAAAEEVAGEAKPAARKPKPAEPAKAEAKAEAEAEAEAEAKAEPKPRAETKADAAAPEAKPEPPRFTPPPIPEPPSVGGPAPPRVTPRPTPAPPKLAPVPLPQDKPKAPAAGPAIDERDRVRKGLAKTRGGFVAKLARLFRGTPKVDDDLRAEVEQVLFTADIGTHAADKLLTRVTAELDKKTVADPDAVWGVIERAALEIVDLPAEPLDFDPAVKPYVLLAIGVNGVGKTTTLGKLAAQHVAAGRKVMLVAGDTFRAAAVEQLDVWARRVGCEIHQGADKADPSSVIFEGITRARKEGFDVVLCDTAGRLHTRKELMDELAKVGRATAKAIAAGAPAADRDGITGAHDTFLVLDATIGQNALAQAQMFKETMDFTGLVVTKLDGTAKGGVVLGICDETGIPIRYIGIGEAVDDLRTFSADAFVGALLSDRTANGGTA